jgi:hypothetical protein
MARQSTTLEDLSSVVTGASKDAQSILTDSSTSVFSFKPQTTDLNSKAVWAVMNNKDDQINSGKIEEEEPISQDILNGKPKPVPQDAQPPIAKGPEFAPEDITGCCLEVTYEWTNDLSVLLPHYHGEDEIKPLDCRTVGDKKKFHIPGAMCIDVQGKFEKADKVTYDEQDPKTMKKFFGFASQFSDSETVQSPPEIVPGQSVIPKMAPGGFESLPMHERMNVPTENGVPTLPPVHLEPKKLIPSIVIDDGLFSKVSGFLPELELTPSSQRVAQSGFVMPDTSNQVIDFGNFRTTPLPSNEEEADVLQPSTSIDLHRRMNVLRLTPFLPNSPADSDDHHMPEPVRVVLRASFKDIAHKK